MEAPSEATGKETMHWTKRPAWIALHFREPGIKVFGDLRTAVAKVAFGVLLYSILVGFIYLALILGTETNAGEYFVVVVFIINCIVALVDAFLYLACKKQKNETHLERLLRATMMLYKIDVLLSVAAFFVTAVTSVDYSIDLQFWILLRIIMCIFHMCLMYCLLVDLRENKEFPSPPEQEEEEQDTPPSAPAQDATGQAVSPPSAPVQEEKEHGIPSPSAPLEPTAVYHGKKVCENIPKKQDEGNGDLAPP